MAVMEVYSCRRCDFESVHVQKVVEHVHAAHPDDDRRQARIAEVVAVVTAWEAGDVAGCEYALPSDREDDKRIWAAAYIAEHEGEAG